MAQIGSGSEFLRDEHLIPLASDIAGADPEEARKYVGRVIREYRQDAGLTARELGERMDPPVTESAVTSWERGRTTPSPETRGQIELVLDGSWGAGPVTVEYSSTRAHPDGRRGPKRAKGPRVQYAVITLDEDVSRRAAMESLLEQAGGLTAEGIWKLCEQAELLEYKYARKGDGGKGAGAS